MRATSPLAPLTLLLAAVFLAGPSPALAQQGGGFGGAGETPDVQFIAKPRTPHPLSAEAARTWLKLHKTADLPFGNETPLEDVLNYVKEATADEEGGHGVQIYVDPVGLQEAEKSDSTPVRINLHAVPLSTVLRMLLDQLDLGFSVQKDGLVVVTSKNAKSLATTGAPVAAEAARTWLRLHRPITLSFPEEAPLGDVLQQIKEKSKGEGEEGLSLFIDPRGMTEVSRTLKAPVRIDLEGVSIASCLDLVTKSLCLVYRVRDDGVVVLRDERIDHEEADELPEGHGSETIGRLKYELEEEKLKAQIAELRAKRRVSQGGTSQ